MPIAPWNPGGYFPFNYGVTGPVGAPAGNRSAQGGTTGSASDPLRTVQDLTGVSSGSGSGSDITGQTIANNLASGPNLASLTNLVNQLNIGAQQQANAARIPNATGLETQSSANIGSELSGTLPQDIITQLGQQAAERGVAIGSPGSDNTQSSLLRALGLTSLDLQQLGQQNLTAAYGRNPVAKLFDPTTQLITPYQQGSLNNQANQLALDWYRTLHPNIGNTGGRGGGYGQPEQPTAPDMGWFQNALNSASNFNRPGGVPTVGSPPPTTYNPNLQPPALDITDPSMDFSAPNFDSSGYNYDPTGMSFLDAPSDFGDQFAGYG